MRGESSRFSSSGKGESSRKTYDFVAGAIVGAFIVLAYIFGIVICPLRRLTGIPCPTCGSTRAFFLLLKGDVSGAVSMQPLIGLAMLICPPLYILSLAFLGARRTQSVIANASRNRFFWLAVACAVLLNWAYMIWRDKLELV